MEITKHFTATTLIVSQGKVLLHFHKKLSLWLPVGGHIDRDELPEETAVREVKEETGLDIKLYNPDPDLSMSDAKQTIRPSHILLEDINEHHQHIDFIYYATSDAMELNPDDGETNDMKWLTTDEIEKMEIPNNVKVCAIEALQLLS